MPQKGATAAKPSTGANTRPGSSKVKKKDDVPKTKPELEKHIEILEREIMMLRKNLDIDKIQEEFKKKVKSGIQESGMNEMFRESLHYLELQLQKYLSSTEAPVSGDLSVVQKEPANAKDEIKRLKQKQTEMEKLINDKDNDLKAKDKELQAQRENIRHAAKFSEEFDTLQSENKALKSKISQMETTIKGHLNNIDTLKNDLTEAQRKQFTVKEGSSQVAPDSKNSAMDHTTEIQTLNKLLEDTQEEYKKLQAELQETKSKMETTIKQHLYNIKKLKEELFAAQRQQPAVQGGSSQIAQDSKNSVEDHTTKMQTLNKLLGDKQKENERLQAELQKAKSKKEELQKEDGENIKDLKKTNDKTNEEIKTIKVDKEKLEKEIKTFKVEKEKLEKELETIKGEKENLERKIQKLQKSAVEPTRGTNTKTETKGNGENSNELQKAREEIEELKNRLSKVVGANIMNENPNIADLSDENRPTKLSEKFSELYDNEWTDAYEDAENEFPTEKEAIDYLYKTLQAVFKFCKEISEKYAEEIYACVLTVPGSSNGRPMSAKLGVTNQRQLKELRKSFAPYLVESVFQHFLVTKKVIVANKKKTEAYLKKCIEICWLMNSQDPPVILDQSDVKGKDFDGDKYRTYTKSGKVVDYVVWPPMLLHKDGPLLCKGVAQCK